MEILADGLLGLAAGFISALSTGGGLLTIPGLTLLGVPPVAAIATSRFGAVSAAISSTIRYQRSGAIDWRYMPYFAVVAVLAGIIGPRILLQLDEGLVENAVGLILLGLLPLLLLQKDLGVIERIVTRRRKIVGLGLLAAVLLYTTMFGAGSGILFLYVLVYCFGMRIIQANATCTVVSLIGSSVALVSFIQSGNVVFYLAIPLSIGALAGGYIGAHTALKKGSAWIKWLLAAVIIVSSVKLLAH
jgi:hypothetical protein